MVVVDTSKPPSSQGSSNANTPGTDELPPSYTAAVTNSRPTPPTSSTPPPTGSYLPEKQASSSRRPPIATSSAGSSSGLGSQRSPRSPAVAKTTVYPAGWIGNLLGTPQAKGDQEVRLTVLGLFQGIIKQGDSSAALPIIQSCYDACRARGLSFESIVQEPSIQGHTPLYWTIVKGVYSDSDPSSSSSPNPNLTTLFDVLVSFPLTQSAYADALQACVLTSSHEAFLRLRRHDPMPIMRMPGDDEALASDALQDSVSVVNGDALEAALNGAFRVDINIRDFQKRMRLFGHVPIEFIARGRMWALTFLIAKPNMYHHPRRYQAVKDGAWLIGLDLIEKSPPTWIDSRITVGTVPSVEPSSSTSTPAPTPASQSTSSTLQSILGVGRPRNMSPIVLHMRSPGNEQLQGDPWQRNRHRTPQRGEAEVTLSDHPHGQSFQYDGCPYLLPDGSLNVVLEAELVKPKEDNPECIIM